MIRQDILDIFRLKPGKKVRLKDHDTGWAQTKELKELGKDVVKERAREILDKNLEDLAEDRRRCAPAPGTSPSAGATIFV